jgi:predicted O-methyltransferase YrrM
VTWSPAAAPLIEHLPPFARPRGLQLPSAMTHAARVTLRAGIAVLAVASVSHVAAPSFAPLATIVAATAIVAFELSRVRADLDRRLEELDADIAQTQPLLELHGLLPTRRPLPQLRGYAIAPDFGVLLAQLVADEQPVLIVETGSGASTVILAYALEKLGRGRVVSLEHDPEYARRTREELRRHGLEMYATIVDAPLEPVTIAGETHRWYALSALDGLPPIDLVIDDGPPGYVGDMLRYASLPVLSQRMRDDGLFVLDVIGDEERAILERWRSEMPGFRQDLLATKKGNVLIRRDCAASGITAA